MSSKARPFKMEAADYLKFPNACFGFPRFFKDS